MTSAARRYILQRYDCNAEKYAMLILISGLVVFFGVHSIPLFPSLKSSLQSQFGAMRFKGIYSLFAAVGFGLILYGMSRATIHPVYAAVASSVLFANLVMPVAFCLLLAAYVPNNFRRVIRNPMLSAITIWAFAHLLANGDLASILLFASFGAYSIIDIIAVNRRPRPSPPARQPLAMDALVLAGGYAAFWIVRHFHAALFGVPVLVLG